MSDEHHAGVMGCAGDKIARTPNLDALAARGVLFPAHYCSSPICTPSRQTFTTGKYVSGHNVWSNTPGVPEGTPTLPRLLNSVGYESYLDGKMHYKGGETHGFHIIQEKSGATTPPKDAASLARPSTNPKPRRRLPAGVFPDQGPELGEEFKNAGSEEAMDTFVDVARRENAIKFLRERQPGAKPFFLTVGFIAPHYPLVAPAEYLAHYRDKVPLPEIPAGYVDSLPLNYKHLRNDRKFENVPPATVKAALEGYYARVEWIDHQIGQVLDALKASPFADNTIVVYTSDHGENMGEHGLWWKNCMYDSGARVPLIMSWPAQWKGGQTRGGACGMVDLVQTVANVAGAKPPADWKGESMVPWLDDPKHTWRDLAVSEYYAGYTASGIAMIRQGDWKYVYHTRADEQHGAERELYNLRLDPKELRNLAADPTNAGRMASMHAALVLETGEDPETTETRWRAGATPEHPQRTAQSSPSARKEPSAAQMIANQDRDRILKTANAALTVKPFSVTFQRSPLSEGGPRDFFSMSDYFWPDPTKPDGKPYIARDGESYPSNFNEHRLALMGMRDATSALAAAYQLTRDERYAMKAAELLRIFFADSDTSMNPALEHAQVMIGKPAPTRGIGLIDTLHLIEVPMAIRALEGSQALTPALKSGLAQWFKDYLTWFTTSPRGKNEGEQKNNHAVAYWLQVAAFNQLVGDAALHEECVRQFKDVFVTVQMAPDGSFPMETRRTKPYAYSIFQLDNMATLCLLLSRQTPDLWSFEGAEGRSMRKAMNWLFPYLADKSKWPLKPDVQAWEDWPIRQTSLLFAGLSLEEPKYLDLWRKLKPDPAMFEMRRNNAVTQPLLWIAEPGK